MIFKNQIEKETFEKAKIGIEIIAIIFAGIFAILKWGADAYWDRQDNFKVSLDEIEQGKKNYLRESLTEIDGVEYCLLEGTLRINNFSKAPMHIENSKLSFVPFKRDKCVDKSENPKDGCFISNTTSTIADKKCGENRQNCPIENQIIIRPVDGLPLFGKRDAVRPFNVMLPKPSFDENDSILIAIDQEVGRGCIDSSKDDHSMFDYIRSCNTSRVVMIDTDLCN